MVAASMIVMFGFYGTSGSFGIFLKPLEATFDSTRVAASSAMSVFMGIAGIIGIFAGRLADKYSSRVIIGIGAVLGGLAYLLLSQANSLWQLQLYFGIMAGASVGMCFAPVIAIVSRLFTENRVLMVGLTTIGISIGQMVLPPVVALFMENHGWQSSYLLLAIIVWVTALPAIVWLRKKTKPDNAISPNQQSQRSPIRNDVEPSNQTRTWSISEVMKTVPFWMFFIINFMIAAGFYIMLVHIVAFTTDIGIHSTKAALILTTLNAGSIAAQLVIWILARRFGSRFTIIALLAIQMIAFYLLMGANSLATLIILGAVYGFGFGGCNTVRLSMVSEIFSPHSAGTIIGLMGIAWAAGGICGPVLAGYIFDISHSYDIAFLIGGLMLMLGMIAGFFLKAPDHTPLSAQS